MTPYDPKVSEGWPVELAARYDELDQLYRYIIDHQHDDCWMQDRAERKAVYNIVLRDIDLRLEELLRRAECLRSGLAS